MEVMVVEVMVVEVMVQMTSTVLLETRWCAGCQDERGFEVPPCEDGHGLDCVDLSCVECGFAIVVGLQGELALVEQVAAA